MIEIELSRSMQKYLDTPKKCSAQLRERFLDEMEVLYEDVEAGDVLVDDLAGHFKIDFSFKSVQYRIIYTTPSEEKILIVYCGPRENTYKKVKRSYK